MRTVEIQPNDAGQRLDRYLMKTMPKLPQGLMYKFIRKKNIKVNKFELFGGEPFEPNERGWTVILSSQPE